MIQPILQNVLIKPCKPDEISTGGIIVPDNCRERSSRAVIVKTGTGTKKKPMKFKEGQTVFHVKDCGDEIIIDGEKYYIIQQSWILAALN